MGVLVQIISAIILSISTLNMGIGMTWPSSTFLLFTSENTTLHRPMTDLDFTLYTSLPIVGTFIAQPLVYVCILDKMGIKLTTMLISMLFVEAIKSLMFYRQSSTTSKEILTELQNIRRSLKTKFQDDLKLLQDVEPEKLKDDLNNATCWQLFKTTSSIRRQFYLVLVLQTALVCQGLTFIQVYAEPIFSATVGDYMSPNLCSVLLGLVTIVAGIVAAYLTDKVGRKPLQIHSSIVGGFCCLFLGTQVVTEWCPMWTIPVFIYVFAISYTIGAGTVPYVVASEIFIPEVKGKLLMLAYEWCSICAFSYLFIFGTVVQCYGLAPAFLFFSFVCFSTTVYFFYFLPETKGLPVYAIQELFT